MHGATQTGKCPDWQGLRVSGDAPVRGFGDKLRAFPLIGRPRWARCRNADGAGVVPLTVVVRRRFLLIGLPLLVAPLVYSSAAEYLAAQRKFDQIASDRLQPGTRVTLTGRELNAFVEESARQAFPEGVRQPQLSLGAGVATGSALIDFNKIRRAQGNPPGWFMSRLLDGEHPVKVTGRLTSGNGRAKVDVDSVEISGMVVNGRLLDFLIQNYLLPQYPTAKIGEPFELGHRIERLEVRPAAVDVLIGR